MIDTIARREEGKTNEDEDTSVNHEWLVMANKAPSEEEKTDEHEDMSVNHVFFFFRCVGLPTHCSGH